MSSDRHIIVDKAILNLANHKNIRESLINQSLILAFSDAVQAEFPGLEEAVSIEKWEEFREFQGAIQITDMNLSAYAPYKFFRAMRAAEDYAENNINALIALHERHELSLLINFETETETETNGL